MLIFSLPHPNPNNPNVIRSNPITFSFAATPIVFSPPLIPSKRRPLRTKCFCFKHDDNGRTQHLSQSQKLDGFSAIPTDVPFDGESLWSNFCLYLFCLHVPMSFGGLSAVARIMNATVLDPQIEALSLLAIESLELIVVFSLLNYTAKPESEVFGFLKFGKISAQRNGLLASAVGFLLLVLLTYVTSAVEDVLLGHKGGNNPILKEILQSSDISRIACVLAYCAIIPLLEETVYRGYLLSTLASKTKWQYAVLISSLIFSAAHFSIDNAFQLFVIGCVLGCSYCWTGAGWGMLGYSLDGAVTTMAIKGPYPFLPSKRSKPFHTRRPSHSKSGSQEKNARSLSSPFFEAPQVVQTVAIISLSVSNLFCQSLLSEGVYSRSDPVKKRAMAKFQEQLKEKARELHLMEKAKELKILLKKGAKVVGKTCKKGWIKVKKMAG